MPVTKYKCVYNQRLFYRMDFKICSILRLTWFDCYNLSTGVDIWQIHIYTGKSNLIIKLCIDRFVSNCSTHKNMILKNLFRLNKIIKKIWLCIMIEIITNKIRFSLLCNYDKILYRMTFLSIIRHSFFQSISVSLINWNT